MSRTLLENDVVLYREDGGCIKFHILSFAGSGASCVVYHAICDDNTEHLLKEYYPLYLELERDSDGALIIPEHKKNNFDLGLKRFYDSNKRQKEVRLSEKLKNFTSNVQGYFYGNNTEYIDMTICAGRTYDKVSGENLYTILQRMKVLTQVIGNYHKKGLLHLDIKPENIYVRPEDETTEDIMLFDFDSVIEERNKMTCTALSYTKTWAAPEQLLTYRHDSICKATDLFSIGEIIFTRIFGRHSTSTERRSFADYKFDSKAEVFKNVNPKVYPLLKELFSHTICNVVERRYQNAEALIALLDRIIPLANQKTPYLISNLPAPNDFFIGRDIEIEDIHAILQQSQILFLHGIGGIGKSELAKQYAKKYMKEYDTIIFAPYVTDIFSVIVNDNCIQINNFSCIKDEKLEEYYKRKLSKMKELIADDKNRVLLIIDNLDIVEDKNIKVLFELGCRVLITSRVDMESVFKRPQMEIKAFNDISFARELFRQYYHFVDDELATVDTIINLVQGHILAIELIAKQINSEWSTVKEICEKLQEGGLAYIGYENVDNAKDDIFSQDSAFGHIKALFDLSIFEKWNRNNELYVLTNMALMPFTGINRQLFAEWSDLNNHGGKTCVNNLIKSGWIQCNDNMIALHPLISDVVIKQCKDNTCNPILYRVAKYIRLHSDDIAKEFSILEENALVSGIANKLLLSPLNNPVVIEILNNLGLIYEGDWIEDYWKTEFSHKYLHRAMEIGKVLYGNNHPYVASLFNNLGVFYKDNADYEKAQYYFECALKIRRENFGNSQISVARVLFNMGALSKDKKDWDAALKYYQQVLHIFQGAWGEVHPAVAQQYSWISYLYRHIGLYELSIEAGQAALNIYKAIGDKDNCVTNIEAMIRNVKQLSVGMAMVEIFLPDPCYYDFVIFSDNNGIKFNIEGFYHQIPDFQCSELELWDDIDFFDMISIDEFDF